MIMSLLSLPSEIIKMVELLVIMWHEYLGQVKNAEDMHLRLAIRNGGKDLHDRLRGQ